jgi:hypothetical protein
MLVTQGPTDIVLNWHRQGLPSQSSEYENSSLSSFTSGILHNPLIGQSSEHENSPLSSFTSGILHNPLIGQSSEYENSPLSSFTSSILHNPLIGPSRSHISATNPIANINNIEPSSWEGALSWAASNHSSSIDGLHY